MSEESALVNPGPASRLTFRRLTGPGPYEFVPWVADELTLRLPPYRYGRAM